MKEDEGKTVSQEIFSHIKKTHEDLSLPSMHHEEMSRVGWGLKEPTTKDGKEGLEGHEMLETLTILDQEERFLLSVDNTLAWAYGDKVAMNYNERFARSSIAIKGQGREDAKAVIGSVKQSISIPTTIQKIRRLFTGKEEKGQEVSEEQIV